MSKRSMMQEVKSMVDSKRILDALLRHLTSNKPIAKEDLGMVLGLTTRKIADTLYAQCITVYTVDKGQNKIKYHKVLFTQYLYGGDEEQKKFFESKAAQMEKIMMPMNMGIAGQVIKSGRTAMVPDVRLDPLYCNQVEEDGIYVPRSMIAVPMMVNNVTIGCIQ